MMMKKCREKVCCCLYNNYKFISNTQICVNTIPTIKMPAAHTTFQKLYPSVNVIG